MRRYQLLTKTGSFWSPLHPTEGKVELKVMGNSDRLADKSGEIVDREDGIDVTAFAEDEIIDPPTVSVFIAARNGI